MFHAVFFIFFYQYNNQTLRVYMQLVRQGRKVVKSCCCVLLLLAATDLFGFFEAELLLV